MSCKTRKIKFRGKTVEYCDDFGKPVSYWVYGYYCLYPDGSACIITDGTSMKEVVPETVTEFIGLYDRSKKEIYEGDIIETNFGKGKVIYNENFAQWKLQDVDEEFDIPFCKENKRKIIGNVFDNPQ